jgi:3-deoxy-D-manno-octulosonic-acid transferase
MIGWCLNLAYFLALAAVTPWIAVKSLLHGKYRHGWAQKLFGRVPDRRSSARCAWFHAVSLGEVNLLAPFLRTFTRRRPGWDVVISATTDTGYEQAVRKYPFATVIYCPLDFTWSVSTALRRIRPDLLVLAELELWPNLIRLASARGAKVVIVNGRLGDKSFRGYRRIRPLVARSLTACHGIAAQSETVARRFIELGARPESVLVSGSLKFDGAETDRLNPATRDLGRLAGLSPRDRIFLAGSTQHPEEAYAVRAFTAVAPRHPDLRMILVPRHPERFEDVARLLQESGLAWERRSRLAAGRPTEWKVLLVDAMGELAAWWGWADVAFVGGSLHNDRGGQNMIEPAAYGAALCFGPDTWNFRDVVDLLLSHRGAEVVRTHEELAEFVRRSLEEPDAAREMGQRARSLVQSQLGAVERTWRMVEPLIPEVESTAPGALPFAPAA